MNKSLTDLKLVPLLILKILLYKLVIELLVEANVVIVPVVDDNVGKVALPELFIDQFKAELLVFICPKKEVLL